MPNVIVPYEDMLKVAVLEEKQGYSKVKLPYRKEITNPHGHFHGGAICSLADTATVRALKGLFGPAGGPFPTVEMNLRFKNPGFSSDIIAEAQTKHYRGKFFKTAIKIVDQNQKLIAEGETKSFLPNYKGRGN